MHLELEPEVDPNAEEDDSDHESVDSEGNPKRKEPRVYKLLVPNLYRKWLFIEPGKEEMMTMLQNVMAQGLEAIQVFERWSKHDELTPYANALEEWDDMVGDDWEAPDKNYLNPYDWIKEDDLYAT